MRRSLPSVVAVLTLAGAARAQAGETKPQKLAPPPPPAWDAPLSTSGTDLATPAEQPPPRAGMDHERMMHRHMAKMRELERRIAELERARREEAEPTPWVKWLQPSLLLQPQLVWRFFNAAASPNAASGGLPPGIGPNDVTATSGGNTTNPDFFRLRRARLKLDFFPTENARFVLEIEPVPRDPTVPGSGTIARQIEAIARLPVGTRVAFELGAGSFEVPFGAEWHEPHGDRPFVERSFFQQNLFPGDFDLGMHASVVAAGHVEGELALVNGRTFGELGCETCSTASPQGGGNLDLSRPKDGVGSVRFRFGGVTFGVSGYAGEGQLVDAQNLRFKQYGRFAVDGDLAFRHAFGRLGDFRAFAEMVYGANMDRGVLSPGNLPAMPVDLGQSVQDRDELGALARVDQELGRFFLAGVRWDYYSPDVWMAGNFRHTLSAIVAIRPFQPPHAEYGLHPSVQLDLEYDHAWDTERASGPKGATKQIDTLSVVLQGRL